MFGEGSTVQWRETLLSQLQARNRQQCICFQDLISHHNSLFDKANTLRVENLQLNVENAKLRSEGVGGVPGAGVHVASLEAKLLAQQEELTQLHRSRGENAQTIIDLNKKLQESDNAISVAEESMSRAQALISSLKEELKKEKVARGEVESQSQCVRDEYQALQLTVTHLEEKLRKAQDENLLLLDRLMKYKAKDAEKLNEENEQCMRARAAILQKELEEAAKEVGKGVAFPPPESVVAISSAVPTNPSVVFNAHDGEVTAVKWNPGDRTLFTGGADRKVKFWNIGKVGSSGTPDCKGVLVGSNQAVMSIDLDSTGTYVIGASNDFATRVWTSSDSRLKHTLTGHCGKVFAAKFLSEPIKIVTGSYDRTIKIWDLRERACIETKFAGSSCYDLVVSDGTGGTIISGHFDRKIRFWDTKSGEFVLNEILVQGKITSLDISKDRKYLLVCVRDDSLKIIDLRMNQISSTFSAEGFKVACDWTRAGFSSGGEHIGVGSGDGGVYVWNTNTGDLVNVLKKHTVPVLAVSWHPFANSLASVDKSKQVVVWTEV